MSNNPPVSPLPGTTLQVSRLCLGTALLGVRQSEPEARRLLDAYLDLGGNFIDTARIYSDWVPTEIGRAEHILGDWMRDRPGVRSRLILATKGLHPPLLDPRQSRVNQNEARRDIESSLRALRCECIELYWLHRDDPTRPVEEIVEFMQVFVRDGKVRYLGVSNWSKDRLAAANAHAIRNGLAPFVANQVLFHAGSWTLPPGRDPSMTRIDLAYHRWHAQSGLPLVPYSTQAQGFFSRPSTEVATATANNMQLIPLFNSLARTHGVSVNAVVLAYALRQPFPVFPVIGPNTPEQLADSWTALGVHLAPSELTAINEANGSGLTA
ncbi:MAG: Aldo/keto reductase [Verrucomicrobiota bacterium]|nr:Aldo/keto reductase [Verrucomicrobiota bacterium]